MTNQKFILQTKDEKQKKLIAVIRSYTNGALNDEELNYLMLSVLPSRQYTITVHTNPESFCSELVLIHTDEQDDRGKIVFGQALFGSSGNGVTVQSELFQERKCAAVIITRNHFGNADQQTQYEIHIYVPQDIYMKGLGKSYEQRFQKAHGA